MVLTCICIEHINNILSLLYIYRKNKSNSHVESIIDSSKVCTTLNKLAKYRRNAPAVFFDNRNQLLFAVLCLWIHAWNIFVKAAAGNVNHSVNSLAILSKHFHNRLYINAGWSKQHIAYSLSGFFSVKNKRIIKICNKLADKTKAV